jgi:hypothetical protein
MTRLISLRSPALAVCTLLGLVSMGALAQDNLAIQGAVCSTPPPLHCPDTECSGATIINQGPVVEMKTRRTYFLDYPCDLKRGEPVTFILSLHGGGSYGNWQRHYFPLLDYKDKYRLVIATPNSPVRGLTSNRILRSDFFKDKVDGWLSLSGGRLGGNPGRSATFAPTPAPGAAPLMPPSAFAAAAALLRELPAVDFSFIYATGQREVDEKGVPETSDWAKKYNCAARGAAQEVVDTRAGYVYDSSRLNQLRPGWGLLPAPGKAQVFTFPGCKDGRVIADVVRLDKGHTEGLEPKITEELVKLMLSAPGGKLQKEAS